MLSFAGLWDRWKNPETGEPVILCTIIVTDVNAMTHPIHDRVPVVLDKMDIGPWLNGKATEVLRRAAEDRLRIGRYRDASTKRAPAMTIRRPSTRLRPDA